MVIWATWIQGKVVRFEKYFSSKVCKTCYPLWQNIQLLTWHSNLTWPNRTMIPPQKWTLNAPPHSLNQFSTTISRVCEYCLVTHSCSLEVKSKEPSCPEGYTSICSRDTHSNDGHCYGRPRASKRTKLCGVTPTPELPLGPGWSQAPVQTHSWSAPSLARHSPPPSDSLTSLLLRALLNKALV